VKLSPQKIEEVIRQTANINVRYSKKARFVTIQRLIVGRIIHRSKSVSVADILILYDNHLNLEDLSRKDPSFRKKFGKSLEEISKILKSVRFNPVSPTGTIKILANKLKNINDFGLPDRNIDHVERRMHNWTYFTCNTSHGVEVSRLPPKRYVGKGYTDKGSARNLSLDGSPKWQEIALVDLPLLEALTKLTKLTRSKN